MCDETWHGWPNRETWALHVWLSNEQATAEEAHRVVTAAYASVDGALALLDDEPDDASSARSGQQRGMRTEDDAVVLDHTAYMLRDPEWGVGMLEDIAAWVAATGRTLDGTCEVCGHGADVSADETCDADGCECPQHEPAPTWERH